MSSVNLKGCAEKESDEAAILHFQDAMHSTGDRSIVRHDQNRNSGGLVETREQIDDVLAVLGIQISGEFVGEQ